MLCFCLHRSIGLDFAVFIRPVERESVCRFLVARREANGAQRLQAGDLWWNPRIEPLVAFHMELHAALR